ncbi:hypothetical protein FGADI_3569 [Fusarium gaditjirri]|uniref:Uncharacterized protein n=1 Tax=Fusarium gaditjirri TaxID=282569 RepID=A0A8H4TFK8_9HYPO|nr:hypothetical protein FGADI_3569 [Fusarium gaditjirri]
MCCGSSSDTSSSKNWKSKTRESHTRSSSTATWPPAVSSYTADQKLRQDRVIHNMGWGNKGFSEAKQRAMAQTFRDEIQKAKDRGECSGNRSPILNPHV